MTDRLIRYDRRIVACEFAAAFARWSDRALLLAGVLIGVAGMRSALADASVAPVIVALAGLWAGFAAARAVAKRLAFHAAETPFAAEACAAPSRRRYAFAAHGVALAILLVLALTARWQLVPLGMAGYAAGAALAWLTGSWRVPRTPMRSGRSGASIPFRDRRRLRRSAGIIAGALAIVFPAAARQQVADGPLLAGVAVLTTAAMLLLVPFDHATIRFAAIAGQRSAASVFRQLRPALIVLAGECLAAGLVLGLAIALTVAITGFVVLLGLAARILAYRVQPQRPADLLLTGLLGLGGLVAATFAPLLPVLVLATLAILYRRAERARWVMA